MASFDILQGTLVSHKHKPKEVGLGNVNNTADVSKPVSTAQQTALDAKLGLHSKADTAIAADTAVTLAAGADRTKLDGIATGANVGVVPNGSITGATKTKVTYDSKGLVTAGADATTADIAASTNKNYVTDAQQTVIGNTSGTNTGDQILSDATITTTDITTNDVSATKHGFAPKVTDTAAYLKGDGTWATPTAAAASENPNLNLQTTNYSIPANSSIVYVGFVTMSANTYMTIPSTSCAMALN